VRPRVRLTTSACRQNISSIRRKTKWISFVNVLRTATWKSCGCTQTMRGAAWTSRRSTPGPAIIRVHGALIAFTGGLIRPLDADIPHADDLAGTPVFFGSGDPDPHVPWQRTAAQKHLGSDRLAVCWRSCLAGGKAAQIKHAQARGRLYQARKFRIGKAPYIRGGPPDLVSTDYSRYLLLYASSLVE
jgi:hypothetical protein